jgi:FkbM family methyltransferase
MLASAKMALTRYPAGYAAARRYYSAGRFLLRRPHDPDYAVFTLFPGRTGVFLDVGANSGSSALSFRLHDRRTPIISVEPNPLHEADLRFVSRLAQPHIVEMWAAGDSHGSAELQVPFYRGAALTPVASMVDGQVKGSLRRSLGARLDTDDFEIRPSRVQVRPLDDLETDVAYLKLDVEGYELAALRGLHRTLERCRPILLVERPHEPELKFLADRGYAPYEYDHAARRLLPGVSRSSNTVFLHESADARGEQLQ